MAGIGPPPKPRALRQRRNRSSGATLSTEKEAAAQAEERETPALPEGQPWHPMTVAFWADVWVSPMAAELLKVDIHGLYILAALVDRFWNGETALAAEIRLQRQCYGLTPIDRRRLQWEVARGEEAEARRIRPAQPKGGRKPAKDARQFLRVVK